MYKIVELPINTVSRENDMEKHISLAKAAELLGVTTKTLRVWDAGGKLKTIRTPGNQRRVPESEVLRILGHSESSNSIRRLYHGSPDPDFRPYYGGGKDYHDYGKGLYCTEHPDAAKEWACQHEGISASYVYVYELDMRGLDPVLDLRECKPAYWLSALAQYRYDLKESRARRERREQFIELFPVDCEKYQVIEGWRADDRYFAYLSAFLGMDISYEAVVQAMYLGDLGQQVVIKGVDAYNNHRQIDRITISGEAYEEYRAQYIKRDGQARGSLKQVRDIPGIMIDEIIRRGGVE